MTWTGTGRTAVGSRITLPTKPGKLDSWFPLQEAFPVQGEALWSKSTLLESTKDWRSRGKCYIPNRAGKSRKNASKHTHDSLI